MRSCCGLSSCRLPSFCSFFFFFNDTATTEIYTLSLHDALPIYGYPEAVFPPTDFHTASLVGEDRKSTRLNSSHLGISYAVFCLKKKKNKNNNPTTINKTHTKENQIKKQNKN